MFDQLSFFVDLIRTAIKSNDIVKITNHLNDAFSTSYSQDQVRQSLMEVELEKHEKEEKGELCLNNLFKEFY